MRCVGSYYDNMSAKQCHGKSLPCNVNATSQCVSQDLVRVLPSPPPLVISLLNQFD
jgi:hypothetical protein